MWAAVMIVSCGCMEGNWTTSPGQDDSMGSWDISDSFLCIRKDKSIVIVCRWDRLKRDQDRHFTYHLTDGKLLQIKLMFDTSATPNFQHKLKFLTASVHPQQAFIFNTRYNSVSSAHPSLLLIQSRLNQMQLTEDSAHGLQRNTGVFSVSFHSMFLCGEWEEGKTLLLPDTLLAAYLKADTRQRCTRGKRVDRDRGWKNREEGWLELHYLACGSRIQKLASSFNWWDSTMCSDLTDNTTFFSAWSSFFRIGCEINSFLHKIDVFLYMHLLFLHFYTCSRALKETHIISISGLQYISPWLCLFSPSLHLHSHSIQSFNGFIYSLKVSNELFPSQCIQVCVFLCVCGVFLLVNQINHFFWWWIEANLEKAHLFLFNDITFSFEGMSIFF